ncbi:pyridoxine 5'-phosphate synthase [Xinfangfangia sp. D13-10-4-6]|uniref:pyridoxine 5'-phosphate synthase n=1 Tax=Pseudogemmobacter hezensis TaxID=2737662 RepID=UPI00155643CE|nr:pyridoxine 5'-phosphate synthase [Pseudogemmobacter hezensis]NPD14557.1 pyridoxine 5'-phosphate synthase [Pseudogemmobacter hezensis]
MADRGRLRLGVNIDHVATLRNVRGLAGPDPLRAALLAEASGADAISAHLREDRRHIRDEDMDALIAVLGIPLNFECAPTPAMQQLLLRLKPAACCLVPEDAGKPGRAPAADLFSDEAALKAYIQPLRAAGIRVALQIDHAPRQIEAAARSGAVAVMFHTGRYAELHEKGDDQALAAEVLALRNAAATASALGLEGHAGHGLTYENVEEIAAIPELRELHIGHFLIGEAVYIGLGPAIEEMRRRIGVAREW